MPISALSAHSGSDVITDFTLGEDKLDFGGFTLADVVADVSVGGLTLSHADGWSVTLQGVSEVTEDEMYIAEAPVSPDEAWSACLGCG